MQRIPLGKQKLWLIVRYDPNKKSRASMRLKGYDYSQAGWYFITINTKSHKHYFGKVVDGKMILNQAGEIARQAWLEIPDHHDRVILDEFVVMPNHVHGIIILKENNNAKQEPTNTRVAALRATPPTSQSTDLPLQVDNPNLSKKMSSLSPKAGSIPVIIRSYKSAVSKDIHKTIPEFAWQSSFHDEIIWDTRAFSNIKQYIIDNLANWEKDTALGVAALHATPPLPTGKNLPIQGGDPYLSPKMSSSSPKERTP